jgi:hypothetical protein
MTIGRIWHYLTFSCLLWLLLGVPFAHGRGSSISTVTTLWTRRPGFHCRQEQGLFSTPPASIPSLRPTQDPVQWVLEALSSGVKRPRREADHSPPSSTEVKEWVELYLHSPNTPSWRGAQLMHRDNFVTHILDFLEMKWSTKDESYATSVMRKTDHYAACS